MSSEHAARDNGRRSAHLHVGQEDCPRERVLVVHPPVESRLLEAAQHRLLREAPRGHLVACVGHPVRRAREHKLPIGVRRARVRGEEAVEERKLLGERRDDGHAVRTPHRHLVGAVAEPSAAAALDEARHGRVARDRSHVVARRARRLAILAAEDALGRGGEGMVGVVRAVVERRVSHAEFAGARVAQILQGAFGAGEPVDTHIAVRPTSRHPAKHVIEGPVLEHGDDHVLDRRRVRRRRRLHREQCEKKRHRCSERPNLSR